MVTQVAKSLEQRLNEERAEWASLTNRDELMSHQVCQDSALASFRTVSFG